MTNLLYGVDLDAEDVTPLMVRDGMLECFYQAHCQHFTEQKTEEEKRAHCREIVAKAFEESGGYFDRPTRKSILDAMKKLMEFSRGFDDPVAVQCHASEMLKLVGKLN